MEKVESVGWQRKERVEENGDREEEGSGGGGGQWGPKLSKGRKSSLESVE